MHTSPTGSNRLLASLPAVDHARFLAHTETVTLVFGDVLAMPGETIRHVYFPMDSFISMVTAIDGRPRLEVGLIGEEGMLGASLVVGVHRSPTQALVQGGGAALRMDAGEFLSELSTSPELLRIHMHYVHVMIEQLAQTAACTRFHLLEPRLARWLLMTRDRAHSDTFQVTHKFLAYMLGVRRSGVTVAATALQHRKLIHYHRGRLTIVDNAGLEAASCSCYSVDRASYVRTMEAC